MDTTEIDRGPKIENSSYNGFFFVIFLMIGSFFLLNFFIGVLFMKYSQAAKNETKGYTEENLVWIDI
jgi:Ion transport protein